MNSQSKKVPLSQAGGAKKLYVALPGAALSIALFYLGIAPALTKMLAVIFVAYALVGLVEVALGESLLSAGKKWDEMPGWKKFLISLVVIVGSLAVVFSVIPLVAGLTM